MSSPHGPNPSHNTPPPAVPATPNVVPGTTNHWGNGNVHTPDVNGLPEGDFHTVRGRPKGPKIDVIRQNDAGEAEKANYTQMGHEAWAVPGKPFVTLARMALKGETRGGKELGMWGRLAAGIGAVALSPGALGYPITLAFRGATNANQGRRNIFRRVVPLEGEAPHELSDKTPSPYKPGYVPNSKPQPKATKPPKTPKQPKPKKKKEEKLPKGF